MSQFLKEENLSICSFDQEIKQLLMLICKIRKDKKRIFNGLILIREFRKERQFLLGGTLPILTIKFSGNRIRYRFFDCGSICSKDEQIKWW